MAQQKSEHVAVLGAGIIGLQTAVTLLQAKYAVTVVADEWADTAIESQTWTSPWAGAQWRSHAAAGTEGAAWEAVTYHAWAETHAAEAAAGHANGQGPSSIASILMDNLYSAATAPAERPPWWSVLDARTFREIPAAALPPGVVYGTQMRAFTLDPQRHLVWLMQQIDALGGRTVRTRLAIDPETEQPVRGLVAAARTVLAQQKESLQEPVAYVNALGLGVATLGIDAAMVPNRGQTLLVKGETSTMRTRLGASTADVIAIIPRPGSGTTIVGSSRGPGRSDTQEDQNETEHLLAGAREVAPDLFEDGKGAVLKAQVGFRPRRGGGEKALGARVEREVLNTDDGEIVVVHAYGHEGAGFQQAIGTAERVRELLGH